MSQALRDEFATDSQGRRYRVNHAVRVTKGGVQSTFWGVMGFASHEDMEKAFAWRRDQIVGDNLQLKIDVDVYNDLVKGVHPPIQLVLDYTEDVAERQIMKLPHRRRLRSPDHRSHLVSTCATKITLSWRAAISGMKHHFSNALAIFLRIRDVMQRHLYLTITFHKQTTSNYCGKV